LSASQSLLGNLKVIGPISVLPASERKKDLIHIFICEESLLELPLEDFDITIMELDQSIKFRDDIHDLRPSHAQPRLL
jgi:hypothetical protein